MKRFAELFQAQIMALSIVGTATAFTSQMLSKGGCCFIAMCPASAADLFLSSVPRRLTWMNPV